MNLQQILDAETLHDSIIYSAEFDHFNEFPNQNPEIPKAKANLEIDNNIKQICESLLGFFKSAYKFHNQETFLEIQKSLDELNALLRTKFEISEKLTQINYIASGTQADVFRVLDPKQRKFYAKRIETNKTFNEEVFDPSDKDKMLKCIRNFDIKIISEIKVLLQLILADDPNLLQVYEIKYIPFQNYTTLMEYGMGSLGSYHKFRLKYGLHWNNTDIIGVASQLFNQIKILRKLRIYHRDIKPDNVIVTNDLRLKLADFGSSEQIEPYQNEKHEYSVRGTPKFMHPALIEEYLVYYKHEQLRKAKKKEGIKIEPYRMKKVFFDIFEGEIHSIKISLQEFFNPKENQDLLNLIKNLFNSSNEPLLNIQDYYEKEYTNYNFEELVKRIEGLNFQEITNLLLDSQYFNEAKKWIEIEAPRVNFSETSMKTINILNLKGRIELELDHYEEALALIKLEIDHRLKLIEQASSQNKKEELKILQEGLGQSYLTLGIIERNKLSFSEALECYGKALEIFQEVVEPISSNIAEVYCEIGFTFQSKLNYSEALKFIKKSLEIYLKSLGEKQISVANAYRCIGNILGEEAKYSEAIEYYMKSLTIELEIHGENHTNVGKLYNAMGQVYNYQREYEKALEYLHKSVNIKMKIIETEDHTLMANSYHSIGVINLSLKKYDEAFFSFEKSLSIHERFHNNKSIPYANTLYAMAQMKLDLNKLQEAEEVFKNALTIFEEKLGENSPSTAKTLIELGYIQLVINKIEEGKGFFEKSIEIFKKIHEENSPKFLDIYGAIATKLIDAKLQAQAIPYLEQKAALKYKIMGNHTDTASEYLALAKISTKLLQENLQSIKEADFLRPRDCLTKSFTIAKELGALETILAADIYSGFADYYTVTGKIPESCKFRRNSISIREKFPEQPGNILMLEYQKLAQALKNAKNFEESLANFQKLRDLMRAKFDENHAELVSIYIEIGQLNLLLKKFDIAIENYTKVLNIEQNLPGTRLGNILEAKYNIAQAHIGLGMNDIAINLLNEAIKLITDKLGNHISLIKFLHSAGQTNKILKNHEEALVMFTRMYNILKANEANHLGDMIVVLGNMAEMNKILGNNEEAYKSYTEILSKKFLLSKNQMNDSIAETLYILGDLEFKMGKVQEAFVNISKSIDFFYNTKGKECPFSKKCVEYLVKIIEADPDAIEFLNFFKENGIKNCEEIISLVESQLKTAFNQEELEVADDDIKKSKRDKIKEYLKSIKTTNFEDEEEDPEK